MTEVSCEELLASLPDPEAVVQRDLEKFYALYRKLGTAKGRDLSGPETAGIIVRAAISCGWIAEAAQKDVDEMKPRDVLRLSRAVDGLVTRLTTVPGE
jgi:hypothetical protein